LKVSHILTRPIITIGANSNVLEAAKLMVERNIGLLVVTESSTTDRLVGVISERDIIRVIASSRTTDVPIGQVCTKNAVTVDANSDVAEVAKAMNQHRIRHVVVLDGGKKPIGVVSMRDLVGERATLTAILQSNEKEVFHGAD
jgi:CBS domain-containing protein